MPKTVKERITECCRVALASDGIKEVTEISIKFPFGLRLEVHPREKYVRALYKDGGSEIELPLIGSWDIEDKDVIEKCVAMVTSIGEDRELTLVEALESEVGIS